MPSPENTQPEDLSQDSAQTDGAQSTPEETAIPPAKPALRLWFPILVLLIYWPLIIRVFSTEMAAIQRFGGRSLLSLLLLLSFVIWWLTRGAFSWKDRGLVIGAAILGAVLFEVFNDPSLNIIVFLLDGAPWMFTLGTIWMLVARTASPLVMRNGLLGIILGGFAIMTLLRWDGLDGRQRGTYSFRWTKSAEQRFLESIETREPVAKTIEDGKPEVVAQSGDWTAFRGGDQQCEVRNLHLADWSANPPKEVWKQRIGPAWSSFIYVDGLLLTQEQRGEQESVVCYDASSGKQVWVHETALRFDEPLSGAGPRGTPSFSSGRVYTLGARGQLTCVNASDGSLVWERNILEETTGTVPQWGLSVSPLVVDDLVIAFTGSREKSLVAFDALTGEPTWSLAGGHDTYSSPQLTTIGGQKLVLMHDNISLYAVDPVTGSKVWDRPNESTFGAPMLQPHLVGESDLIVATFSGLARLHIDTSVSPPEITTVWETNRLRPEFNDILIHQGHLYGLDDGILCCLDAETGKREWKRGRYGHGQLLLLPDSSQIVVLTEQGELVLVAADPQEHRELGKTPGISGKTWNHPIISHGRIYLRNAEEMACYQLKLAESRAAASGE